MLIYLKYIRKNVPPFIFRVEVLPKKAVLKINKIYIISSSFWWKKYVLHDFEIECRQFRKRMRSTHLSDSNWRACCPHCWVINVEALPLIPFTVWLSGNSYLNGIYSGSISSQLLPVCLANISNALS